MTEKDCIEILSALDGDSCQPDEALQRVAADPAFGQHKPVRRVLRGFPAETDVSVNDLSVGLRPGGGARPFRREQEKPQAYGQEKRQEAP